MHLDAPVTLRNRQVHLAEDEVDDAVDDLVLAGDVVVDGHRLDPERLRERPDRQRRQAAVVGDARGAVEDALSAQRRPRADASAGTLGGAPTVGLHMVPLLVWSNPSAKRTLYVTVIVQSTVG